MKQSIDLFLQNLNQNFTALLEYFLIKFQHMHEII